MKHKKKKMEGKMSSASMSCVSSGMQLELLINRREKKIHKKHLRNNGEKNSKSDEKYRLTDPRNLQTPSTR